MSGARRSPRRSRCCRSPHRLEGGTGSGSVTSSPAGHRLRRHLPDRLHERRDGHADGRRRGRLELHRLERRVRGATATCIVSMSAVRSVTATFTLLPITSPSRRRARAAARSRAARRASTAAPTARPRSRTAHGHADRDAAPARPSSGWSGACTGASHCTVTLERREAVTATFTLLPVQLKVSKAGTGSGTVSSSPAGIACGTTARRPSPTARRHADGGPAGGSKFTGWSGACSGTAATCTVSLERGPHGHRARSARSRPPIRSCPTRRCRRRCPVVVAGSGRRHGAGRAGAGRSGRAGRRTRCAKAPTLVARPKISGKARAGAKLTCGRGTWNNSPTRYTFTWRSNGKVVGHAATYTAKKSDRGPLPPVLRHGGQRGRRLDDAERDRARRQVSGDRQIERSAIPGPGRRARHPGPGCALL